MRHTHGCSPHHAGHHHIHAGTPDIHGGHNIHATHHMNAMHNHMHNVGPTHPGPFQGGPFGGRRHYGPTFYYGQYGSAQHRGVLKVVIAIGATLLTVSLILLFCGILNFAGVIPGETFSTGIPLLGFGGILCLAGIMFTALGCISLKSIRNPDEVAGQYTCPPPEQLPGNVQYNQTPGNVQYNQYPNNTEYNQYPSNAEFNQSTGKDEFGQPPSNAPSNWSSPSAPLPASAPPPYTQAAVYPGQAPDSSTQRPYPDIGFVVPSATNP